MSETDIKLDIKLLQYRGKFFKIGKCDQCDFEGPLANEIVCKFGTGKVIFNGGRFCARCLRGLAERVLKGAEEVQVAKNGGSFCWGKE